AAVLEPEVPRQFQRERAEAALRKLVAELSRSRRVLVVPYAIDGAQALRPIRRALGGVFMRCAEQGLLPDARLVRWVEETARDAAALPGMRTYKDDGRALPDPGAPKRLELRPAAQDAK
ncbi:MAG: hypothetical protein PHF00_12645, partial [Elusimicrobia bacterium]|nr:hypothetical protein [Elusimicrobiota bacterium]